MFPAILEFCLKILPSTYKLKCSHYFCLWLAASTSWLHLCVRREMWMYSSSSPIYWIRFCFCFICGFLFVCLFYYVFLTPSSELGGHSCVGWYLDLLFCPIGWQICLGAVTCTFFFFFSFFWFCLDYCLFLFFIVLSSNLRLVIVIRPVVLFLLRIVLVFCVFLWISGLSSLVDCPWNF